MRARATPSLFPQTAADRLADAQARWRAAIARLAAKRRQ